MFNGSPSVEVPNVGEYSGYHVNFEDWELEDRRMTTLLQSGIDYEQAEQEVGREQTQLIAASSYSLGDYIAQTARLEERLKERRLVYEAEEHCNDVLRQAKALLVQDCPPIYRPDYGQYDVLLRKKDPWRYVFGL